MYFDILHFSIGEKLKEVSLCTISFLTENGSRHLFCLRWESFEDDKTQTKLFAIHWLFNWTRIWKKTYAKV